LVRSQPVCRQRAKQLISYSLAQDGTETFPYGFSGYGQVETPDGQFNFAGGVQGGTDPNGGTLTASGFHHGRLVRWGNAQWTPTIDGLVRARNSSFQREMMNRWRPLSSLGF
jgi:hypothetical protein